MLRFKSAFLLFVRGLAMGAADVVPGVSGGTIAFITGIYDELLSSLKKCNPMALKLIFTEGFAEFWAHINGNFLLILFSGVLLSIKTFASIVSYFLETYPLLVWGFFSGLILASVIMLAKQQKNWQWLHWLLSFFGVVVVVALSLSGSMTLPDAPWALFVGGFIAICAMILPGVSGSFILLLLGLYPVFLSAIDRLDIPMLAFFVLGCVSGLLVFSRFLSWLLTAYFKPTLAVLMGFLVGSLNVTWPWKVVETTYVDRHGETLPLIQSNVLPQTYASLHENGSLLVWVLAAAIFGFLLVFVVEFLGQKLGESG